MSAKEALDTSPAARLQSATAAYQKLQAELSRLVEARQRVETQATETGMVKKVSTLVVQLSIFDELIGLSDDLNECAVIAASEHSLVVETPVTFHPLRPSG